MKYSIIINGDTDGGKVNSVLTFPANGKIIKIEDTTLKKVCDKLRQEATNEKRRND